MTENAVYLQGLTTLLDYLRDGGDLDLLRVGKIAADHIPIVRGLLSRKVLIPAPLQPRYLQDERAQARLRRLRVGASSLEEKVEYMKYYRRNFDNVEMSTL